MRYSVALEIIREKRFLSIRTSGGENRCDFSNGFGEKAFFCRECSSFFALRVTGINNRLVLIKREGENFLIFSVFWEFLCKIGFLTGLIGGKNSFSKPLSKQDEERYVRLLKDGKTPQERREAKEVLVRHNMRLVAHIVKKYRGAADSDDLISVGSLGLIKALDNYREGRGTTLATFAARCIENEILMLLRSNKKHKNVLSLSDPVGLDKDGNELTLIDVLAEKEEGVFENAERSVSRERLVGQIRSCLTQREFEVVFRRYALLGGAPMAQREVAALLHISRSYVSRIEKRAIAKLRNNLSKRDFYD